MPVWSTTLLRALRRWVIECSSTRTVTVQQSAGEPGVAGVTVNLWTDDDGDGTPDTQIATTTTGVDGAYGFDDLDPDLTYVVQVVPPADLDFTLQDQGDDELDSDVDPLTGITGPIDLEPGENNPTIDAGLVTDTPTDVASLGDLVFFDENADGLQSEGEPGVAGVTVNLWTDDDGDGTPDTQVGTTTTDGDGNYAFDGSDPASTTSWRSCLTGRSTLHVTGRRRRMSSTPTPIRRAGLTDVRIDVGTG